MDRPTLNERLRRLATAYMEALRKVMGDRLVSVVLFGSVARGEATPFSDIDFLVVAEGLPQGRFARREALKAADQAVEKQLLTLSGKGIAADFCVIVKDPEEVKGFKPLYLDLVEDALLLYDRDGFFADVLTQFRQRLKLLGARRLHLGRVLYWDLKPDITPGEIFEL